MEDEQSVTLTSDEKPLLNTEIQVEIKTIVANGYGLGHSEDGKVVFVPYSTAGDVLTVKVHKEKKNFAEGRIISIIKPSEDRITPPCTMFGTCGGCDYQHITYEKELAIKQYIIEHTLRKMGKIDCPIHPIIACQERGHYRNHVQIKSSYKKDMGFFMKGRLMVAPFPEEGCMLLPTEMMSAIQAFNKDEIKEHHNVRVRQNTKNNLYIKGLLRDNEDTELIETVNGINYYISIDNFFQTNRFQISHWLETILKFVGKDKRYRTIADVYCGVGLISYQVAHLADCVIGIESNKNAIKDANRSMELNPEIKNLEFIAKTAEKALPDIEHADLVIVDPPRSGLTKSAMESLIKLNPEKIVSVSCDTATFTRDCMRLKEAGYGVKEVQPLDMFPMTSHVELIALIEKI